MVIARVQGIYFLLSGLWPIINMASFEKVSGPKTDKWLVKTLGLLVAGIGALLILQDQPYIKPLGIISAACLLAADVYYVIKRVIPSTYLLDAAAEVAIIVCWLIFV
jgi:hypothetical protein